MATTPEQYRKGVEMAEEFFDPDLAREDETGALTGFFYEREAHPDGTESADVWYVTVRYGHMPAAEVIRDYRMGDDLG